MAELKTTMTDANVHDFIRSVDNPTRQQDAFVLLDLYQAVTGEEPKMWGPSIIGFGKYHYKSERSSQEGDWPLIAFSPRKQSLTLYFMPGFDTYGELLGKLGKHTTSKSCLYIQKLADVDIALLKLLIEQGYKDAKKLYG